MATSDRFIWNVVGTMLLALLLYLAYRWIFEPALITQFVTETIPNIISYSFLTYYGMFACAVGDERYCRFTSWAYTNDQVLLFMIAPCLIALVVGGGIHLLERFGIKEPARTRRLRKQALEAERKAQEVRTETHALRSEVGLNDAKMEYNVLRTAIKRVARRL